MKETVVLVCGYGCHLTLDIRSYLDAVISFINKESPDLVITSGGFTNKKTAPGVSEAGMMKEYLVENDVKASLIYAEDGATTTTGNLLFSKEVVDMFFSTEPEIVIYCDGIRSFKIKYEAKRIFNKPLIKKHDFKRSWKEKLIQYFLATPLEIFSFHFSSLLSWKRELRKRINQNS